MFGVEHDMLAREILEVNTFELIEDQTIDIDSIEEFSKADDIDWCYPSSENIQKLGLKLNEVIRAVKHLNKEIQSIKK